MSDSELDLGELTPEQRRKLGMLGHIRRSLARAESARLITIGAADDLISQGELTVEEVCSAFECSRSTFVRWRQELRSRLQGRSGAATVADADQAAAEAREALSALHGPRDGGVS